MTPLVIDHKLEVLMSSFGPYQFARHYEAEKTQTQKTDRRWLRNRLAFTLVGRQIAESPLKWLNSDARECRATGRIDAIATSSVFADAEIDSLSGVILIIVRPDTGASGSTGSDEQGKCPGIFRQNQIDQMTAGIDNENISVVRRRRPVVLPPIRIISK